MKRPRAIGASVVLIGAISGDAAGGGPSVPTGGSAPGRGRAAPSPRGRATPQRGRRHQPSSTRRSSGGRQQRPPSTPSREVDDILDLDLDDDGSGDMADMFPFDDDITSKLDRDIMAELDRLDGGLDPDEGRATGGVGYPPDDDGEYLTTDDDGGDGSDMDDEDYAGTSSEKGALYDAYNLLHSLAQVRNSRDGR